MLRAFRARLADVHQELEAERKKNESGSIEWLARIRKLTEELTWLRSLSDKLTSENKVLLQQNQTLQRTLKTQEDDREFLIKQLVSVKKENAQLRAVVDRSSQNHQQQHSFESEPIESLSPRSTIASSSAASRPTSAALSRTTSLSRPATSVTRPQTSARPQTSVSRSSPARPVTARMPEEDRVQQSIDGMRAALKREQQRSRCVWFLLSRKRAENLTVSFWVQKTAITTS